MFLFSQHLFVSALSVSGRLGCWDEEFTYDRCCGADDADGANCFGDPGSVSALLVTKRECCTVGWFMTDPYAPANLGAAPDLEWPSPAHLRTRERSGGARWRLDIQLRVAVLF